MLGLSRYAFRMSSQVKERLYRLWLTVPELRFWRSRAQVPLIVAMTSYPGRADKAWIAVETLLRQTVVPENLILVLNEEEFPNRVIPRRLSRRLRQGLQIMWVEKNGRSYDKLLPVRAEFPNRTIVTVDDDKYFPRILLASLFEASQSHPGVIIGARGWKIEKSSSGGIHYGDNWVRANPGDVGHALLTPGGNGCLYPPSSLDDSVDSYPDAQKVCPSADDIWFWGAAMKKQTQFFCLGMPPHRPITHSSEAGALSSVNKSRNDEQFQAALDFFGIREFLNVTLARDEVDRHA